MASERWVDGYRIRAGAPIPPKRSSGQASEGAKYPWGALDHMDCIEIPDDGSLAVSIRTAARAWLQRNRPGWKYTARKRGDHLIVWFYDPRRTTPTDSRSTHQGLDP